MNFEYVDIHSHPYFKDYDEDRDEQISQLEKNNIATISIGVDFETSKKSIDLSKKSKNIFACVGEHPDDLNESSVFDERISKLAEDDRVVAIGECGLDYFRIDENDKKTKDLQKEVFESYIELSVKLNKPLMLHIRPKDKIGFDAYFDTLDILESHFNKYGDKLKGNSHFFVGNMEVLKRFLNIGFAVSFGGVLTFTHEYDEYVKYTPIDKIMSETDAPFVAPVPYRGKRNSPVYIPEVVKAISSIRGEDFDYIKKNVRDNAISFFNLT